MKLALLWLVVALEIVSPVPGVLSLGAVWVLLFRPRGFLDLVHELYGIPPQSPPTTDPTV